MAPGHTIYSQLFSFVPAMFSWCLLMLYAIGDIDPYLEQIPQQSRWKLDKELDWDNDFDRDLTEIAQCIVNWQGTLRVHLGLTETDVDRINQETTPTLRQ